MNGQRSWWSCRIVGASTIQESKIGKQVEVMRGHWTEALRTVKLWVQLWVVTRSSAEP